MGILKGHLRYKKYRKTEDGYIAQSEWTSADSVEFADGTTLEEEREELKKSVSDGKALVAAAITEKKVKTAITATFAEMAANIRKIVLGSGNATKPDVLSGKTFTNDDGVEYTGTMTNNGAKTASLNCGGSYTIPKGYHNGSGKVTANSLASQTSATATKEKILKDYTAWVNGVKLTGTMPSRTNASIAESAVIYNDYFYYRVPYGYYPPGNLTDENGNKTISEIKYPLDEVKNKVGYTNYINAVVTGLQYSGIEVSASTSATDLQAALSARFPQKLVVYEDGEYTDGTITSFTASSTVKPTGVDIPSGYTLPVNVSNRDTSIHMYFGEGTGYGAAISDVKIDVSSYKTIRINGAAGRAGATLYGVLYDVNSYASLATDPNSITFNLNEDYDLSKVKGDYYIGIFGYAYYGEADITSITLTA